MGSRAVHGRHVSRRFSYSGLTIFLSVDFDFCLLLTTTGRHCRRRGRSRGDDDLTGVIVYNLSGTGIVRKVTFRTNSFDIPVILNGYYICVVGRLCIGI